MGSVECLDLEKPKVETGPVEDFHWRRGIVMIKNYEAEGKVRLDWQWGY